MIKILGAEKLDDLCLEILRSSGIAVDVVDPLQASRSELLEKIGEYDGLIVRSKIKVDEELLSRGRKLKIVGRAGVGYDNVDLAAANEAGVLVVNTPDASTKAVAEHTFFLMGMIARDLYGTAQRLKNLTRRAKTAGDRASAFKKIKASYHGTELSGKVLGVIGGGRIGSLLSEYASKFGMRVLIYDPGLPDGRIKELKERGVSTVGLGNLFRDADYISLHCPLTDKTYHLINDAAIRSMKRGVAILNCSRGELIDEGALIRGIQQNKVRGAALDVFEEETHGLSPQLNSLERVIATPHIAGSTSEAQAGIAKDLAHSVVGYLKNGTVRNAIGHPLIDDSLLPFANTASLLGAFASALYGQANITHGRLDLFGESLRGNEQALTQKVLEGMGMGNYVSAVAGAKMRGLEVDAEFIDRRDEVYQNFLLLRLKVDNGLKELGGSPHGNRAKITQIGKFPIDVEPQAPYALVLFYKDQPGIIAAYSGVLARYSVNIASAVTGRNENGNAMTIVSTDREVSDEQVGHVYTALKKVQPPHSRLKVERISLPQHVVNGR